MIHRFISFLIKKHFFSNVSNAMVARPCDFLIIMSMLYLASWVYGCGFPDSNVLVWGLAIGVFGIVAELAGVYRSYRDEELAARVARLVAIWGITIAVLVIAAFMTKTSHLFSRGVFLLWFVFTAVSLSLWHIFVGAILRIARTHGHNMRRAAVVGVTEMSNDLAKSIISKPWMGIEIIGHFEDRQNDRLPQADSAIGPFLGNHEKLVASARAGELDIIYISFPMRAEERINKLVTCLGATTASVYIAHSFAGFTLLPPHTAPRWNQIGDVAVLGIVESPFHGLLGWLKQVEDMILGAVLLAISSIPMLLIALTIRLTSKGPIFFRQTRYGLNGKRINVLKFRTMTVCENGPEIKQASRDDDRVTKVGKFLRRTSMDELPQFLHVMTGKMSIVGPRPHAVAQNEMYREMLAYYMVRHKVKPGITGWAQVNGWRGETDTDEKMRMRLEYDLIYIRNWSLLLDIKIIFMTVFSPKTHRNAY